MSAPEVAMPMMTGIRCHIEKPIGATQAAPTMGVSVGDYIQASNGGRAVVLCITDEDGLRRAAVMHIDKADLLARMLSASVKRARHALWRDA